MPTADDFRQQLQVMLCQAALNGQVTPDVCAGTLHRLLGGYPNRGDHRMPVCCRVMLSEMRAGDNIVHAPPKGQGPSLIIRYVLPRP